MSLLGLSLLIGALDADSAARLECSVVRQPLVEVTSPMIELYQSKEVGPGTHKGIRITGTGKSNWALDVVDLTSIYRVAKLSDGRLAAFDIETMDGSRSLAFYSSEACRDLPVKFQNFSQHPPRFMPRFDGFQIVDGEPFFKDRDKVYLVAYRAKDGKGSVIAKVMLPEEGSLLPLSIKPLIALSDRVLAISVSPLNLHGFTDVNIISIRDTSIGYELILSDYSLSIKEMTGP